MTSGPLIVSVDSLVHLFTHSFHKHILSPDHVLGPVLGLGVTIIIKGKYINKERSYGNIH